MDLLWYGVRNIEKPLPIIFLGLVGVAKFLFSPLLESGRFAPRFTKRCPERNDSEKVK